MPQIRCPSCKNVFTATEGSRGTQLACPSCDRPCRIPVKKDELLQEVEDDEDKAAVTDSPPPRRNRDRALIDDEPDDDDEEETLKIVRKGPRKKRRGRQRDGDLERVNLGLGFYYACILTLLVGFLTAIPALIFTPLSGGASLLIFGLLAMVLVDWAAPILGIVGSVLCLWAPQAYGARGLCIASLTLNAGAMLLGLFREILSMVPQFAVIANFGVLASFVMTFIAWCLFMGFLRQLSTNLDEDTLAEEATAVMLRGIAILVLAPVILFVGGLLVFALPCFGAISFLVIIAFSLYGLFLFLKRQLDLIGSIRQVIASRF